MMAPHSLENPWEPKGCWEPVLPAHLYLSLFLIIGIIVSYLPQQRKIIKTRSSEGLSPWYLLLGALSSISNFLNVLILQAPMIECCYYVTLGQSCYNLLGLFQMASQTLMFLLVFALFFLYFPNDHKFLPDPSSPSSMGSRATDASLPRIAPDWANAGRAFRYTACYTATVIALSLFVWSWSGGDSTSRLTLAWTGLLALVALVASMIQFIPQILRTWKLKMVGALSIPAMAMQAPGSFLFCYTIAQSPGTNFTSWITYFVGGCLQSVLLFICIYYQYGAEAEFVRIPPLEEPPEGEGEPGSLASSSSPSHAAAISGSFSKDL